MVYIQLLLALKELVVASGAGKNLKVAGASAVIDPDTGHSIITTSSGALPGMNALRGMIGTVLTVPLPTSPRSIT